MMFLLESSSNCEDGVEDYRRHLADLAVNARSVLVVAKTTKELATGAVKHNYPVLRRIEWQNLRPGHLVYLEGTSTCFLGGLQRWCVEDNSDSRKVQLVAVVVVVYIVVVYVLSRQ